MENQMNVGNQNTQQMGQNPVNQPMIPPERQKTNYLMIAGIVLACFVVFGFGGYYLGIRSSKSLDRQEKVEMPLSTATPTVYQPSPSAEKTNNMYSGNGFQVELMKGWINLTNNCQEINVTKSDAIELELSIDDYIRRNMNISDVSTYNEIISSVNKDSKYLINFLNVPKKDVVIVGPTGEGELNNVYIRGPEGTGYYHINVLYNGPIPDTSRVCLGNKSDEYKQVLSTFQIVK